MSWTWWWDGRPKPEPTATINGKPTRTKHEAKVVKAVERYREAWDHFCALADQACDRAGESDFDREFLAADAEVDGATAELWPHLQPRMMRPIVHEGVLYAPSSRRRSDDQTLIEMTDVRIIH